MASVFTHALVGVALGRIFRFEGETRARFWILSAACAVLPDADVVGLFFGIRYGDAFGHRGFSHSLLFALLSACLVVLVFFRAPVPHDHVDTDAEAAAAVRKRVKLRLILYFFLVTASHALLDALTNGGLGVAFFAPFDPTRYFFPFRPVEVSPIGISSFFSSWGLAVIRSELLWIWLPVALLDAAASVYRKARRVV